MNGMVIHPIVGILMMEINGCINPIKSLVMDR